jgi:hypothetical protein
LTWHSGYSWNSRFIKKSIIPTVILVPLFYNIPIIPVLSKIPLVHAIEYNDIDQASKSALTNVYNVFLNLKYVENDIENGESPQTIIKEVRTLLTNYRLKDSLQKSFPLRFHLLFEIDIPDNSFLVDGVEHDVPCVFQIWQKR